MAGSKAITCPKCRRPTLEQAPAVAGKKLRWSCSNLACEEHQRPTLKIGSVTVYSKRRP